jgi:hypothetical protein
MSCRPGQHSLDPGLLIGCGEYKMLKMKARRHGFTRLVGRSVIVAPILGGCAHDWAISLPIDGESAGGMGGASVGAGASAGSGRADAHSDVGGGGPDGTGGGGPSVACTGPNSIDKLQTTFDGFELDPQWAIFEYNDLGISQANGKVTFTAQGTATDQWGGIVSTASYDLRDCAVSIKLVQPFEPASGGYVYFNVINDMDEKIEFAQDTDHLYPRQSHASEPLAELAVLSYDRAEHVYLRIRETAGIIYWETSADATGWTVQHKAPNEISISNVHVSFGGGTLPQRRTTSPGAASFDAVNISP